MLSVIVEGSSDVDFVAIKKLFLFFNMDLLLEFQELAGLLEG